MNSLKMFWHTVRAAAADRLLVYYVIFLAVCCAILCLTDPNVFNNYGEAAWCCFETIMTVGFGDVIPDTVIGQIIITLIGISSLFVLAILTGVVVSFFNERVSARRRRNVNEFGRKLEHLSELSHEELCEIEERYRDWARSRSLESSEL